MTNLKPCPFCGGEAEFVNGVDHNAKLILYTPACYARCKNCGVSTKTIVADDNSFAYKDEVAELWNRRVNDD